MFRSPRSFLVTSPTEISPFGLRDFLSAGHTPAIVSHSPIGLSANCTHHSLNQIRPFINIFICDFPFDLKRFLVRSQEKALATAASAKENEEKEKEDAEKRYLGPSSLSEVDSALTLVSWELGR